MLWKQNMRVLTKEIMGEYLHSVSVVVSDSKLSKRMHKCNCKDCKLPYLLKIKNVANERVMVPQKTARKLNQTFKFLEVVF